MNALRSLLVCVALVQAGLGHASSRSAVSVDQVDAGHGEVILSLGAPSRSTADAAQRDLIGRLTRAPGEDQEFAGLTIDYPHDESIFPPDIKAPTFLWHDPVPEADRWLVEVAFDDGASRLLVLVPGLAPPEGVLDPDALAETNAIYEPTEYQASARAWKPGPGVWNAIKDHSVAGPAVVTLFGYRSSAPSKVLSRGRMALQTSKDPVGAPIFYRDVPLIPPRKGSGTIMPLAKGAVPLIAWRLRDVSLPASRVLFSDMPTCANCHSFSADGKTLGMDIDGPQGDKGAYAVSPIEPHMVIDSEEIITWNSFSGKSPPGHKTLGFLSRVSPDGQHVVTTLNERIYVANFEDHRFGQVFFPTRGILAYYSRETGEIQALPGAADPEYVHTDGVWTPDGKTIIFARAGAKDPFPEGRALATYAGDPKETQIQYDLYSLPFNGGRGGTPQPVLGASGNGMSNTFPKVSPDGKWVVYVQCKNGQLMRPDSKLWIVPAAGGEPRLMRCNTDLMNSWHSFSPNSRWMVFSSKSNTPYTQLFLTHINEDGSDSPPILIENSTAANRAANIPEFINVGYDDLLDISVPAVSHYRYFHRGKELAEDGQCAQAVAEYEKALKEEPDAARVHASLSKCMLQLDQPERAMKHTRLALEQNPYNFEMQTNLGFLLIEKGDFAGAREHLDFAILLHPRHPVAWFNRATLFLQLGDYERALADYTETLQRQPRYPDALDGRGVVLRAMGDLDGARADFDESIRLNPASPTPWYMRALVRRESGDLAGAASDVSQALDLVPPGEPRRVSLEELQRQIQAVLGDGS